MKCFKFSDETIFAHELDNNLFLKYLILSFGNKMGQRNGREEGHYSSLSANGSPRLVV